jgi:hypothetical protein
MSNDETMTLIHAKTTSYGMARGQWITTLLYIRNLPTAKQTA